MLRQVDVVLVYVHLPHDIKHVNLAERFVDSYSRFKPLFPHRTVVVCNGSKPNRRTEGLFHPIPNVQFIEHDDTGWDIGAYISTSWKLDCDMMFCCGGPCHFKREGWLKRIVEVWEKYGPGMYGTLATYAIRPHLQTSGFAIPPELLREYTVPVVTRHDRALFEHGPDSIWLRTLRKGMPGLLVTWDGVWNWQHWRKPKNIYRRGDQSNCLTYFRYSDDYEHANAATKRLLERQADTLRPNFDKDAVVGA